ncbi:ENTH-domain-containing protein [Annulohypoxylon truncatum]|uniref:ENTH-domain-containing protein n=1 Tax=Annulohypoxylon truncatum TaxID=327061 RepID=UPI002007BFD3|nr:ENTH-domain-containing protein [Annulohypoxylon truncatum]KAI1205021.1 ENTH-domain-containing protein [Annulohypoxylon truncatum]
MSKVMRSVKNVTKGYSSVQVKVREATSNDPWGPTGTQMSEIAQLTYNSSTEFYDIVDMLDKRLNDKGKNWRHVLKALKVLDYCLHEGSELVVTWARKNIYIIKTLREFVYIDEDGRDVGQNVRVAAKELTALILDEERLRAERSDRKTWKSRVTGIEEFGSDGPTVPQQRRPRPRRHSDDEEDAEYRLAIEASKQQEEEDRRKRESRQGNETDDDLAKAIKLSKEEEERRRRELEETNASSLFDDDPVPSTAPQPTGMNMGYQQGSNVDWLGNPIDQNQMMQPQPTGYMNNAYTGYPQNGYSNGFNSGFNPQPTGMYDPYAQQQQNTLQPPQQQQFQMQPQPTGYNPYGQQPQFQQFQPQPTASPEPPVQPGSNNPWASNNNQSQSALKPMPTGSNNPFATGFGRPQTAKAPPMPTLGSLSSLPEQKSLQTFTPSPQPQSQLQPQPSFNQPQQPQKQLSEHEQRLNALLASGDGMDTFGNTGELRIPAQHTAPGTFVNSAGANANKLTAEATGSNPFLRQQYTGMPTISYGQQQMPAATGPVGMNGYGGAANPFAARPQQQNNNQGQDLIQF